MVVRAVLLSGACFWVSAANVFSDEPEPRRSIDAEWQRRDVWSLKFEGNAAFDADELKQALSLDGLVTAVVDPVCPHEEFLDVVARRLREGYRAQGYQNVVITATAASEDSVSGLIRIQEGEQFTNGRIVIECDTEEIDSEALENLLQVRPLPNIGGGKNTDTKKKADKPTRWKPGKAGGISDELLGKYQTETLSALKSLGYWFAAPQLQLVAHQETRTVDLVIRIDDRLRRQALRGIRFEGLTRHTPQQLLDVLQLKKEEAATQALADSVRNRLLTTGRFITVETAYDAAFGPDVPVDLIVRVLEYDKVPMLQTPFEGVQVSVARLAERLAAWEQFDDDLEIRVTLQSDDLKKMVGMPTDAASEDPGSPSTDSGTKKRIPLSINGTAISAVRGTLQLSHSLGGIMHFEVLGSDRQILAELSVLMTRDHAGFINHTGQRCWLSDHLPDNAGMLTSIHIEGHPHDQDDRRFQLKFGFGVNSDLALPLQADVQINPAAVLDMISLADAAETRLEDGIWHIVSKKSEVRLEADTGRMRHVRLENFSELKMAPNLVRDSVTTLLKRSESFPNDLKAGHEMSSLIAFCGRGLQILSTDEAHSELLQTVVRILSSEDVVDETVTAVRNYFRGDRFRLPAVEPSEQRRGPLGVHWSLSLLKSLVPAGSPAHRLASHLISARDNGNYRTLQHQLDEFSRDPRTGPLTCLLVCQVLPPVRLQFAEKGLASIDRTTVPDELLQIIEHPCVAGNLLKECVRVIRALSEDEFHLLSVGLCGKPDSQSGSGSPKAQLAMLLTAIRQHPSDNPEEVVKSAVTLVWQVFGCDQVTRLLEAMRQSATPVTAPRSIFRPASQPQSSSQKDAGKQKQEEREKKIKSMLGPLNVIPPSEPIYKPEPSPKF
ncbi:MAG: hypothetical protein R3C49_06300 [Planctomycetaceae bacterium]